MFCVQCGSRLLGEDPAFCVTCGSPVVPAPRNDAGPELAKDSVSQPEMLAPDAQASRMSRPDGQGTPGDETPREVSERATRTRADGTGTVPGDTLQHHDANPMSAFIGSEQSGDQSGLTSEQHPLTPALRWPGDPDQQADRAAATTSERRRNQRLWLAGVGVLVVLAVGIVIVSTAGRSTPTGHATPVPPPMTTAQREIQNEWDSSPSDYRREQCTLWLSQSHYDYFMNSWIHPTAEQQRLQTWLLDRNC